MNDEVRRVLSTRAANSVAHTRALAEMDPAWGSRVEPIADGWLVLAGPGLYVNRAMDAGNAVALSDVDIDRVIELSIALGVPPAVEVSAVAHPTTVARLVARGFARDADADITLFTRPVPGDPIDVDIDVSFRHVRSGDDLRIWQETSALGWGHVADGARRASDAYAAAAFAVPGEHLVVAHDADDGRALGCAVTTVRAGVAGLGGMSTLPEERRRGVQGALVAHRIEQAHRLGCDLTSSTAAVGSASARNLRRHGFVERDTIETHVQRPV